MKKSITAIILFLLQCLLLDPVLARDIEVRYLTVEDGLSHYTVNSIYQDEFGMVWFGTMDGLNRYDGNRIDIFRPVTGDKSSLQENNIRQICGDGKGHLYIKGLHTLTVYDMRSSSFQLLEDRNVRHVFHDGNDLWYADENVIYKWDASINKFRADFRLKDHDIRNTSIDDFIIASNGDKCICTAHKGYLRVNAKGRIIQQFPIKSTYQITEDHDRNIWIATRSEGVYLIRLSGEIHHFLHDSEDPSSLLDNNVRQICQDPKGDMWMSTFKGLCRLKMPEMKFTPYSFDTYSRYIDIKSIISMMCDNQGGIWLGSYYEGAKYYNPSGESYRLYKPDTDGNDHLRSAVISSVVEDSRHRIWLGTEGGGVCCINSENDFIRNIGTNEGLSSNIVKSLLYDPDSELLYAATLKSGLDQIDLRNGRVKHLGRKIENEKSAAIENVVDMKRYGADTLFLATNTGVVVYNLSDGRMTRMKTGFDKNYRAQAWSMAIDQSDNLWFTTSTDMYRYNLKTKISNCYTFKEVSGTSVNNNLNSILLDSHNRLWFGSSGSGVFLYDRQTDSFSQVDVEKVSGNGYVTALAENTEDGVIYVGTNNGIVAYDAATSSLSLFNRQSGFPQCRIYENSLFITSDQQLMACNMQGVIATDISLTKPEREDYRVFVSRLSVNNKEIRPDRNSGAVLMEDVLYQHSIALHPNHTSVSFDLASTDYINNGEGLQLEYKMEGFDKEFIRYEGAGAVTYTNLSPGEYTFEVRGIYPDSSGQIPHDVLHLKVIPPFYKTPWFILLCLAACAALVMWLVRTYTTGVRLRTLLGMEKKEKAYIQQANQEKLRLFTNISHEFRTPLTLIDSQLELLLKRSDLKPSVYSKVLNVYKNSRKMRYLVDEIVDIRKQESGNIRLKVADYDMCSFLREIFISFDEYAKQKEIGFSLDLPDYPVFMKFDQFQMEKVFLNLLSNAFKFTPVSGQISLSAKSQEDRMVIAVTDNGAGIAPENMPHVFERFFQDEALNAKFSVQGSGVGLSLTKSLVEMHGGTISVESQPAVRTCFTVCLPLHPVFPEGTVEMFASDDPVLKHWTEYSTDLNAENTEVQLSETSSYKMLIVEDNDEVRNMLVQIFSGIYQVEVAANGEDGISKAQETAPDIILSDVMMPGISGFEMCRRLKNNFETCHIPIVLLTAKTAESQIIEGLQTGADDYVTKPFSIDILISRCNNLVKGRQRLQMKYQKQPEANVEILTKDPREQKMLEEAVSIVKGHLDDAAFNVEAFAREMGLSRTYLFTKIKGLTGQSPNDFISTIRLKHAAARLIQEPDLNMTDIAYALGFSSSSYFIKCFKNQYGETPAAYRKKNLPK